MEYPNCYGESVAFNDLCFMTLSEALRVLIVVPVGDDFQSIQKLSF